MSIETLFVVLNNSVLPAWLLLVFAPRWRWTMLLVHSAAIPLLLGLAYALLLFTDRGASQDASFLSLRGVMAVFTSPQTVVGAWVHYLIFDLFVGAWEVRDAHRRGIRHAHIVPSLVLTLLFGPVGLGTYLLLRFAKTGSLSLDETPVA